MKTRTTKRSAIEEFLALSDEEKERVYQECEHLDYSQFRPMTPAERRRWDRLRRKGPARAAARQSISVSLEKSLLKRVDSLARKRKLSRSQVIAEALRSILAGAA